MIQAIETQYKGYRFRSRLEARWAVFFDTMGIEWRYESEGYRLPSGYYLPDFWFPNIKAFGEVKPAQFTRKETFSCVELVSQSKSPCIMLSDVPQIGNYVLLVATEKEVTQFYGKQEPFLGMDVFPVDVEFVEEWWADDWFGFRPYNFLALTNRDATKYREAVDTARSARFEHGEQP